MLSLNIPKKINIIVFENHIVIEGPLGHIKKKKSKNMFLYFDRNLNKLWLINHDLKEKHFYLAILNKLILGVWKGFSIKINIIGVGYKAFLNKNTLSLKIGFNHLIYYKIPNDISIKISPKKLVTLVVFGNNFQKVQQVAAEIRSLKPVEPYKGKGIKYFKEVVKKKEGKKTNV